MHTDTASILIQIFLAFAIALAGGALSATFARTHRQLCRFISLGAGALLGLAVCGIGPDWFGLQNVPHEWFKLTMSLMLANACGGFLYLAIHAVWGEIFRHHKGLVLGNFAARFGVIAALILYFRLKA